MFNKGRGIKREVLQSLFIVVCCSIAVFSQIDRARADPYADLTKYFGETVNYAERKDRDAAIQSAENMRKALGAINGFSADAPNALRDGNMRDLGDQAGAFVESIKDLSDKLNSLQEKLKRTGEDYSSEVSNLKSSQSNFQERFNVIWSSLQRAGRALKIACSQGCFQ